MTAASQVENDAGPPPFGEDEPVTSGVLDIRALADAYESEIERRRAETEEEEPPMVSPTGLGLLMPRPEPEQQAARPRLALWALTTLVMVAATAVVTAFVMQRTMKPALAAAAPTAEQCAQLSAAPTPVPAAVAPIEASPAAAAAPALAVATAPSVSEAAPVAATKSVERDRAEQAVAAIEAKVEQDADAEERSARREARRAERAQQVEQREPAASAPVAVAAAPVVEPSEPAPAAEPEPEPAESKPAAKCDEVACLVDPSSACCAKREPVAAEKVEAKQDLPERLSASDVNAGLRPRRGRIDSCGDRHGFTGTASIKLTITPAGKVGSVEVEDGNSAFQSCIAGHIKKASFGESQQGMTLTYPIVFR